LRAKRDGIVRENQNCEGGLKHEINWVSKKIKERAKKGSDVIVFEQGKEDIGT